MRWRAEVLQKRDGRSRLPLPFMPPMGVTQCSLLALRLLCASPSALLPFTPSLCSFFFVTNSHPSSNSLFWFFNWVRRESEQDSKAGSQWDGRGWLGIVEGQEGGWNSTFCPLDGNHRGHNRSFQTSRRCWIHQFGLKMETTLLFFVQVSQFWTRRDRNRNIKLKKDPRAPTHRSSVPRAALIGGCGCATMSVSVCVMTAPFKAGVARNVKLYFTLIKMRDGRRQALLEPIWMSASSSALRCRYKWGGSVH